MILADNVARLEIVGQLSIDAGPLALEFSPDGNPDPLLLEPTWLYATTVDFSPDGSTIALSDGSIWSVDILEKTGALPSGQFHIFSLDGELVVSGNGGLMIFGLPSSQQLGMVVVEAEIVDADFSSDGKVLAATTSTGAVIFWGVLPLR